MLSEFWNQCENLRAMLIATIYLFWKLYKVTGIISVLTHKNWRAAWCRNSIRQRHGKPFSGDFVSSCTAFVYFVIPPNLLIKLTWPGSIGQAKEINLAASKSRFGRHYHHFSHNHEAAGDDYSSDDDDDHDDRLRSKSNNFHSQCINFYIYHIVVQHKHTHGSHLPIFWKFWNPNRCKKLNTSPQQRTQKQVGRYWAELAASQPKIDLNSLRLPCVGVGNKKKVSPPGSRSSAPSRISDFEPRKAAKVRFDSFEWGLCNRCLPQLESESVSLSESEARSLWQLVIIDCCAASSSSSSSLKESHLPHIQLRPQFNVQCALWYTESSWLNETAVVPQIVGGVSRCGTVWPMAS